MYVTPGKGSSGGLRRTIDAGRHEIAFDRECIFDIIAVLRHPWHCTPDDAEEEFVMSGTKEYQEGFQAGFEAGFEEGSRMTEAQYLPKTADMVKKVMEVYEMSAEDALMLFGFPEGETQRLLALL